MHANLEKIRPLHVFDQVADAVILLDRNSRIEYLNQAASRLFGINPDESIGAVPAQLFVPVTPNISCEEVLYVAQLKGSWRGDMIHMRRDGTKIHTECSVSAIVDEQSDPIGFLIVSHDISRFFENTVNQELNQNPYYVLDEFHKMEAVGRLAGVIAHDFNNHLAGILGNLSVAVRRLDAQHPIQPLLIAARGSAEQSSHLVKQLLSFSRHRTGDFVQLNLNDTLVGLQQLITPADRDDLSLELTLEANLPLIKGDSSQLAQAVVNLVVNAQEVLENKGVIHIRTQLVHRTDTTDSIPTGTYILLEIEDNGSGMDPEIMGHMFEPFFSTKQPRSTSGAGLGLSVVWGIVQRHNGYIEADSKIGRGTRFRLYFPALTKDSKPEKKHSSASSAPQSAIQS